MFSKLEDVNQKQIRIELKKIPALILYEKLNEIIKNCVILHRYVTENSWIIRVDKNRKG